MSGYAATFPTAWLGHAYTHVHMSAHMSTHMPHAHASYMAQYWTSLTGSRTSGRLYSYGLYSYDLFSYGLYRHGLHSYGLHSYGPVSDVFDWLKNVWAPAIFPLLDDPLKYPQVLRCV